jgi:hypothetical protein
MWVDQTIYRNIRIFEYNNIRISEYQNIRISEYHNTYNQIGIE